MECGSRLVLFDLILVVISLLTHIVDLFVNLHVLYRQFYLKNYWIAALISVLAFIPGFITSILSCFWVTRTSTQSIRPKLPALYHVFRILCIVFLMSPISGYANSLYYLWKRHQALSKGELEALQRSWEVMAVCVTEVTLLRLFYAFLNTCPLMIVQMYLFVQTEGSRTNLTEGWIGVIATVNSLISFSIAVTTYDRAFHQNQPDKEALRVRKTTLLFFVHLFHLGARILAIGLFASLSIDYTALLLGIHWIVMIVWLMLPLLKSSFQLKKILSVIALGGAFVFVFINSEGNRTQRKYAFYYTISLVGNTAMMVMWFKHTSYSVPFDNSFWFNNLSHYLGLVGHYVLFFVASLLLVLHHVGCFHEQECQENISIDVSLNERQ